VDVRPAVANADCIVLPSYREGLSRVLTEAAAMGKPLVASDVPGCREIVLEGKSGFLCRPAETGHLAVTLARMAALSSEDREQMGEHGREHVKNDFDEARVVKQYSEAVAALAK
jgi:glycosyltransferase involved in cell wall biosynthesis